MKERQGPDVGFDPNRWLRWSELQATDDEAITSSLKRLGAYVVARFKEPPDAAPTGVEGQGPASPWGVVYVGETHGRTRSLRLRLAQFEASAGIYAEPSDGHYAAWAYRSRCAPDLADSGPLPATEVDQIWVALCPNPFSVESDRQNPDARGVLPGLTEAQLLWRFVESRGGLPVLNNAGSHGGTAARVRAADVANRVSTTDIQDLLDKSATDQARYAAAGRVLKSVVEEGWGYAPRALHRDGGEEPTHYAGRYLGGQVYAYVGWTDDDRAFFSLWAGEECVFGETDGVRGADQRPTNGAKPNVAGVRKLIEDAQMVQLGS